MLAKFSLLTLLAVAAPTLAKIEPPPKLPSKVDLKPMNFCKEAHHEIQKMVGTISSIEQFKLGKGWSETTPVKFDFDGDGKMDRAFLAERKYTVPFVRSRDEEFEDRETEVTEHYLVVLLSNHGKAVAQIPTKGASLPESDGTTMIEASLEMKKNVLQVNWNQFQSSGSWWTSTSVDRWRFEKEKLRLIGKTSDAVHRASHEGEGSDFNLVTGQLVTYTRAGEPEPDEGAGSGAKPTGPVPQKVETKTKKPPETVYLENTGECDTEDVFVRK